MNSVNYLNHTLYNPDSYHRRFDLDVPSDWIADTRKDLAKEDSRSTWENQVKRIGFVALPFLSLVKPLAGPLSILMGGVRVLTQVSGLFTCQAGWQQFSMQFLHAVFAAFSVASSFFRFTIGLLLTTTIDLIQGLFNAGSHLIHGEYRKAIDETLQLLASTAYLGFMLAGALEAMLLFSLLQVAVNFSQAQKELAQGNYLEAAAKIGMGCIRLHQTNGYAEQIQRRNRFFALQTYASFIRRSLKAREVRHLLENPLADFKGKLGEQSGDIDFGTHFHGFGQELVKGANLTFRTRLIDGQEMTELDFKVNHVFREKIEGVIQELSQFNQAEMNEILQLTQSHGKGIRVEQNQLLPLGDGSMGPATKISLDGLGSIFIGATDQLPTMYNRVVVQMDAGKNVYDFHELMTLVDLDQSFHTSSTQDIERLKIGQLFRVFQPQEAILFERSEEFFNLPLDQLKERIIQKAPAMKTIFDEHLAQMRAGEIVPGKVRYQIDGLAEKAYEHGARGLTAAITGAYTDQALFERVASMLDVGMLSTELRRQANINANGMSPGFDFYSGGADSVFTQLITEKNCREEMPFNDLNYTSKIRFLISLEALESGTYQYFDDLFGNRHIDSSWGDSYSSRPGILDFVDGLQNAPKSPYHWSSTYSGHEVMLKERVDPSFFTKIVVANEATRSGLMDYLRERQLIQLNGAGQEMILGAKADQFITVAKQAREELFV